MKIEFYKYQGTGNDFILIDNRSNYFPKNDIEKIRTFCNRKFGVGADGLILLENSKISDFKMVYFNADGNQSSMCGNGGRCIVAFAHKLNLINNKTVFDAIDGLHNATIDNDIVSLQMKDVNKIEDHNSHLYLDTGSPHHIEFCNNVSKIEVINLGRKIRNGAPYFKIGTNVNFVEQINDDTFKVRTYERGVEDETLSCGTGVTAVAIATNYNGKSQSDTINIETLGGNLKVSFLKKNNHYKNIYLTGKATFVFQGNYVL